jgi:hypothetical protein
LEFPQIEKKAREQDLFRERRDLHAKRWIVSTRDVCRPGACGRTCVQDPEVLALVQAVLDVEEFDAGVRAHPLG